MSKFANRPAQQHAAVQTTSERADMRTHERAAAWSRDAKSDLFLLAITNMVSEDTFYESAAVRDKRFIDLVHQCTHEDPIWVAHFAKYLRHSMQMRSASVQLACEYAAATRGAAADPDRFYPPISDVIDSVCVRADEPGEVLAYWISAYGRKIPMGVKRGVAKAARRLYNERNLLKYDGQNQAWRFADVIELVHPRPADNTQSSLFRFAIDRRHNRAETAGTSALFGIVADREIIRLPETQRRGFLAHAVHSGTAEADLWRRAGWSWERLAGWLPGGMDAEAWEAVIPQMGVMALLRNLRNFDQARISEAAVDEVIARITDEENVVRSRIFPFRVWAAYREAPSDNWKRALGKTLELTCLNLPTMAGGTLVAIDCSGSMRGTMSGRSKLARWEVAAVMAAAMANSANQVDLVVFGDRNARVEVPAGTSALKIVDTISDVIRNNTVGSSTYGHTAIRDHWDASRHRRALLVTDDQMWDSIDPGDSESDFVRYHGQRRGRADISHVPRLYTFNLAGYAPSSTPAGQNGRFTFGGFTDQAFVGIDLLERGKDASWPF